MIQAEEIRPLIVRLNLQDDIELQEDGSITCAGIAWKRMRVINQTDIVSSFIALCHLPKPLWQDNYVPAPMAFRDEYDGPAYPLSGFKNSPNPSTPRSALNVVVISCIKIDLADGLRQVVKIAAVDVATCRILMNHLVCNDPKASVKDWKTSVTGMTSFQDMEQARLNGYKVFRGHMAARGALSKFVDDNTVIVGHNLRADLDALRMVHGCAVDVAKVIEKAAGGPLSKRQLQLNTLSRDFSRKPLSPPGRFGRDALQNAFAIRELALWCIKNPEQLSKQARQLTTDYQRMMPAPRA
jgi:hypothetical protein